MEIKILTPDASKEEEIKTLEKISKLAPKGSYLSSLFSPRFIDWVTSKIRNDVGPDMVDYMDTAEKDYTAAKEVQQHTVQVETIAIEKVAELKTYIQLVEKQRDTWRTDHESVVYKLASALEKVRDQELEIIRFKAEVYDLERKIIDLEKIISLQEDQLWNLL